MKPRRFIAGAICPGCGVADRLVVEQNQNHSQRRCVSCGYRDPRPSSADSGQVGDGDSVARPVRLVDEET